MDDFYTNIRKLFFGEIYFQRLLEINDLFSQIADDGKKVEPEQLVVCLIHNIGKLKIASQAADSLLNELEGELHSKYELSGTEKCAAKRSESEAEK